MFVLECDKLFMSFRRTTSSKLRGKLDCVVWWYSLIALNLHFFSLLPIMEHKKQSWAAGLVLFVNPSSYQISVSSIVALMSLTEPRSDVNNYLIVRLKNSLKIMWNERETDAAGGWVIRFFPLAIKAGGRYIKLVFFCFSLINVKIINRNNNLLDYK